MRHRYVAAAGVLAYCPPFLVSKCRPTQPSSNRSSGSGLTCSSRASVAAERGPASNASNRPSETAANIALERRNASIRSKTTEASAGEKLSAMSYTFVTRSQESWNGPCSVAGQEPPQAPLGERHARPHRGKAVGRLVTQGRAAGLQHLVLFSQFIQTLLYLLQPLLRAAQRAPQ